ncbi:MAG: methyltransferase [Bacillales bacterium]|jgi:16S rRNA (guanine1207-N2)-methyltransferase|nr:methyltransferase [Bacillales bacterium]
MSHYFQEDTKLDYKPFLIKYEIAKKEFSLYSSAGLFSKNHLDYGTKYLLEALLKESITGKVLDLGCGIGVIGITLSTLFSNLTLTYADINNKCLEITRKNLEYSQKSGKVILSDGFLNIKEMYDAIVMNPPIRVGKEKLKEIFTQAQAHLNSLGSLYLVIRKDHGGLSWLTFLEKIYQEVKILDKRKGYLIFDCKNS